jgi:ribosomal protein S18 acetylase RimI-like enzyme
LDTERLGEVEVYVYYEGPNLIGYGSLGKEEVRNAETGALLGLVHVLPYLAVHSQFRRQKGLGKKSWGRRILGGLIEEVERRAEYPWLFLYVDPENPAKGFYSSSVSRSTTNGPTPRMVARGCE